MSAYLYNNKKTLVSPVCFSSSSSSRRHSSSMYSNTTWMENANNFYNWLFFFFTSTSDWTKKSYQMQSFSSSSPSHSSLMHRGHLTLYVCTRSFEKNGCQERSSPKANWRHLLHTQHLYVTYIHNFFTLPSRTFPILHKQAHLKDIVNALNSSLTICLCMH